MKLTSLPSLILALASAPIASAAIIASDSFSYTTGGLSTQGSAGSGWVDGWNESTTGAANAANTTVPSGSLSYGTLLTSGNSAQIATTSGSTMFRQFSSTLGGSGTNLWMSFLVDGTVASSGLSLFSGTTEQTFFGPSISSSPTASQYTALYYAGAGRPLSGATVLAPTLGTAMNTGTHLMVINIDQTGASPVYKAWLDPAVGSLGTGSAPTGGTSTTINTTTQAFTFDRIRLGLFATGTIKFDELRLGDTWADVSPIPEPSTALLSLVAGVSFLGFSRRR